MSGIYIPDIKMPERCIDCPFMIPRDNDDCILQSAEANAKAETWDALRKGCPLIPVPDHGRLIDADAVHYVSGTTVSELDYVRKYHIDRMPTIIPAEGRLYDSLKRGLEQAISGECREEVVSADNESDKQEYLNRWGVAP